MHAYLGELPPMCSFTVNHWFTGTGCPRCSGGYICGPCSKCWPNTKPASANMSQGKLSM